MKMEKDLTVHYSVTMEDTLKMNNRVMEGLCKFFSIVDTFATITALFDLLSSGSNRWHSLVWFSLEGDSLSPLCLSLRTKGTFFSSPGLQRTPLPIKNQ